MSEAPFTVSPDSLAALASSLGSIADDLNDAVSKVRGGDAAAAENAGLENQITAFQGVWATVLASLQTTLDDLQTALQNGSQGYSETDRVVSGAASS